MTADAGRHPQAGAAEAGHRRSELLCTRRGHRRPRGREGNRAMGRAMCSLVLLLSFYPSLGAAVESSYDCVHTGHTNIGWSHAESRYTAEAQPQVKKSSIVKLSELNTDRPFLTGQGVARLQRLAEDGSTIWLLEQAPAGTIILWTFFAKRMGLGPPTSVLVSTKTYDFMGPVNFTDVYACKPNPPSRGRE